MEEFVSISDFVYKDYEIHNVGDGDSFCYCPCDIYGTPKLYYADCHFACARDALQDILDSFHGGDANDVFNDDEWNNIVQDIWLDCISEPGRVFFGKYIVVGFDGHIPNREYVDGVISYLGGSYKDYVILYNEGGRVHELSCDNVINGTKNKPIKLGVPNEIIRLYDMKMSKMNMVNRKFPTNMTKAEYYSLIRQENKQNKNMDKKFIRLTESDLHRIVKESVNRILSEVNGSGNDKEAWRDVYNKRMNQAKPYADKIKSMLDSKHPLDDEAKDAITNYTKYKGKADRNWKNYQNTPKFKKNDRIRKIGYGEFETYRILDVKYAPVDGYYIIQRLDKNGKVSKLLMSLEDYWEQC